MKGWDSNAINKLTGKTTRKKKFKTFYDLLGPEDILHHNVLAYLKRDHPGVVVHHSPNEGKRSPFERFKFKYLGGDAGFPDLIFPELQMVMELKILPNKPTPAQKRWLVFFLSIGWSALVVYDLETAQKAIIDALKAPSASPPLFKINSKSI